jgi:Na+/H+ antiporter NhaD/arsenite permease-like protein
MADWSDLRAPSTGGSEGVLVVVLAALLMGWEQRRGARRPHDEELEGWEAQHGRRLLMSSAAVVFALAVGLILERFGVRASGWLAVMAAVALLVVIYIGPWLDARRRRRRR